MNYGFTFNGVHSSTFGIVMRSKGRQVLPSTQDAYMQVPGRAGSYLFPQAYNDRIISVDCAIITDTLENLRSELRDIAAWLSVTDREALVFDDEPDKTYMAKLDNVVDLTQTLGLGEFSLEFRAEPFAQGITVAASNIEGVAIMRVGTASALPILTATFTAAATEYKLLQVETGDYVRVVTNFAVGDVLVIDCDKQLVSKNGLSAMNVLALESDFFKLVSGSNTFTATPNSATLNISYMPRWL